MDYALSVRRRVFVEEQGVSEDEEIDEHDGDPAAVTTAVHVLGRLESTQMPVATARLLLDHPPGEYPHIGRVAVLREFRGLGYGRAVMEALHEEARRRGIEGITLAAQLHALPFYEHLGYVAHGDAFLDARIEHRRMDLRL
ncbi:MAG: GNAT family N-acetyltransferase [Dehalococcoidia bacterium]|nr:GNAT family N-acetyltransferase [Dehalococcoidia bacterium]